MDISKVVKENPTCCVVWSGLRREIRVNSALLPDLSRATQIPFPRVSPSIVSRALREGPSWRERQTSLLSVCGRLLHCWVSVRLRCCSDPQPLHIAPRFSSFVSNSDYPLRQKREWITEIDNLTVERRRRRRRNDPPQRNAFPRAAFLKLIQRIQRRTTSRQSCRCDEVTSRHRTRFSGLSSANLRVKVSFFFQMLQLRFLFNCNNKSCMWCDSNRENLPPHIDHAIYFSLPSMSKLRNRYFDLLALYYYTFSLM